MAARRTRTARAPKPTTDPVEGAIRSSRGGPGEEDDVRDGDDDDAPPPAPPELDDEPDADEPDEEPAEKLESQLEIEAAVALQKEENAAALRAHDTMQSKARGNRLSAESVRKAIEAAKQKVRHKHLVRRRPGIYTAQPLTTINENGERIECPPFMRLPDSMVARLRKARDLKRLLENGVLEDLR
jgi:hypothetical protein